MRKKLLLISIALFAISLSTTLLAKDLRRVDLTFDNTGDSKTKATLALKINTNDQSSVFDYTPEEDDSLTVYMKDEIGNTESISIEHQFIEINSKDFTAPISSVFNPSGIANKDKSNKTDEIKISKQITDIRSNSWLIIKFVKINGNGTKTILTEINYRTEEKFARFFTSTGIAVNIQPDTSIVIENTKDLVKNEQEIMEYQKVLKENNASPRFRMAQSFFQFLHFIPCKSTPIAFSLGLPLNNIKIYEDPYFGISLFIKYKNNAAILTVGGHFHKNITIAKGSGFEPKINKDGELIYFPIDPKNQFDIAAVPKDENNTTPRFFIAVTFKL